MATTTPARHGQMDPNDPYFYGWRDVKRVTADGKVVWDRISLTQADILHPQEGDHVTQNRPHGQRSRYLTDVCATRLAGDPSAVVLNDVQIIWDVAGLDPHGPDVSVIVGVREQKDWSSFRVGDEGVRPKLLIEVTSPSTVVNDLTTKVEEYARTGVEQYVIVDGVVKGQAGPVRLLDYHLVGEVYQERPPDARGWVWLAVVGIWLGVVDGELVCFDEAGVAIPDYTALTAQVRALEDKVRQLRGQ